MGPIKPSKTLSTTEFLMQLRIGNGYDIHRLVQERPLILEGQPREHPAGLGLDGHSDADVLVHAIMDGLLGALSLGDIGKYFPPTIRMGGSRQSGAGGSGARPGALSRLVRGQHRQRDRGRLRPTHGAGS